MNPLKATIKWEAIKWWHHVGKWLGIVLSLWMVMLMPVPGIHWDATLPGAVIRIMIMVIVTGAWIIAMVGALYLIFAYPFTFAISRFFIKSTVLEQGSSRSSAYHLSVRVILNIFTCAIGLGILFISLLIAQRFPMFDVAWIFEITNNQGMSALFELILSISLMTTAAAPLLIRTSALLTKVPASCRSTIKPFKIRDDANLTYASFLIALQTWFSPMFPLPRFLRFITNGWHISITWVVFISLTVLSIYFLARAIDRFDDAATV